VALSVGASPESIGMALRAFRGLSHRLELVCERDGRRYWNDSKSTTPAATIAALSAMSGPTWLLAGGIGKGADFSGFAKTAARRTQGIALFGRDRQLLFELLEQRGYENCYVTDDLASAFRWCCDHSHPGDSILLSPGCASLDQFRDYADRGDAFCKLARGAP
jgi:UDP-N-acetylmuramoylalanine--D-glutamate ligase